MTITRLQLALNVEDIDRATDFYTRLFGVTPHKQRPGYTNFVVDEPPLKLVLFENPGAEQRLNHLGIETSRVEDIPEVAARFEAAGLETTTATSDLCCHAVQDKIFVSAPDVPNGWWEYYAITDDTPDSGTSSAAAETVCCAGSNAPDSVCCASPQQPAQPRPSERTS